MEPLHVYGNEVSDRKGPQKTIAIVEKKYIDFSIKYLLLRLIPHMEFLNLQYMEKKVFKTLTIIKGTMSRHCTYMCKVPHRAGVFREYNY